MERRQGAGVGTAVLLLGLVLSVCLLPYLVSSIYSVASAVIQTPAPANWLWGDWLSTLIEVDSPLYMVLAEGPICCAGALGLLIIVLGTLLMASGREEGEAYDEGAGHEGMGTHPGWDLDSESEAALDSEWEP